MFSRFKPVPFDPYGRQRSRARVPRWLLLLLSGIALGGGGVIAIQQHYLPPRLSASESTRILSAYQQADAERAQLQKQLDEADKRLATATAARSNATLELEASRAAVASLREDIASLVTTLPSDPRGGRVEVRAGQFTTKGNTLDYDLVLTRDRTTAAPMTGVLQLVVAGDAPRGADTTLTAQPVALSIGSHQIVHGSVPIPEGFKPRETTVRILDRTAGEQLGMRVLRVR